MSRLCFTDFQKRMGYVDVKLSPVYFYVQKWKGFNTAKTPIPFDVEILNVGGAMNLTSGKFTAPRDGFFSFSFTGSAYIPKSSSYVYLHVLMYLNGKVIGKGWADEAGTAYQNETFSFQSTLEVKKGDEIWLEIDDMSTGASLYGDRYTHFSGSLLEENMASS